LRLDKNLTPEDAVVEIYNAKTWWTTKHWSSLWSF
jgi:hypothetical protein